MTESEFDELRKPQSGGAQGEMSATAQAEQASATATANLEGELQFEKEARREERFLFVVFIIVLIDAFIFMQMQTWAGPIVIGLIELVILTVYARRCGIDEVAQLLDYIVATPEKARQIRRARRGKRRKQTEQ